MSVRPCSSPVTIARLNLGGWIYCGAPLKLISLSRCRPMVFDGLPCIDRAPAANNVIVAAGNDMIGLASAPATGKLVAELARGADPHLDPTPYSLARFSASTRR